MPWAYPIFPDCGFSVLLTGLSQTGYDLPVNEALRGTNNGSLHQCCRVNGSILSPMANPVPQHALLTPGAADVHGGGVYPGW